MRNSPSNVSADGDAFFATGPLPALTIYNGRGVLSLCYAPGSAGDGGSRQPAPLRTGCGGDFYCDIDEPRFSDAAGGDVKPESPAVPPAKPISMVLVVIALIVLATFAGVVTLFFAGAFSSH